jgi:hypothetical protein
MAIKEAEENQSAEPVMSMADQMKLALEESIREKMKEAAAKTTSMNINMDAALYKKADALNFGELKTDEVYYKSGNTEYVAQGFTDGIVYTEVGHWEQDDIKQLAWESKIKNGEVAASASDSSGLSEGNKSAERASDSGSLSEGSTLTA